MKKLDNISFLIIISLIILDIFVWQRIFFSQGNGEPEFFFLDVGQGDGTLGVFEGGVKFLVDAGPGAQVVSALQDVLRDGKYIDLAFVTHPQLDHFGGFNFVLEKYDVGAFVLNGRQVELPEWQELIRRIEEKRIPTLILGAGDKIIYRDSRIDFLSPDFPQLQSAELNDSSLVNLVSTPEGRVLLTGDIGENMESYLVKKFGEKIFRADVLKVPHHGSKYSSSQSFLDAVGPKAAFVEVGKNTYGHPTETVLSRLEGNSVKVFRTDKDGTLEARFQDGKLVVFSLK